MKEYIGKFRGFTLFEVMLLLVVASVLMVAALRYAKHQQEIAADQIYGLKLYTLGQAVNAYIASATNLQSKCQLPGPTPPPMGNPSASIKMTNCKPGGTGMASFTATGVSWLYPINAGNNSMGNPFLPQGFSFAKDLSPLQMATVNPDGSMGATTGDNAIVTTVIFTQGPNPPPPTIIIQTGGLFEAKGGVDSTGKPLPPVFMPALTQDAITHANTMYSANLGPAAVNYTFPYVQAGGGSPKPSNVTGLVSAVEGAPNLEVQGSNAGGNKMRGTINFDSSAGINAAVTGVNAVNFVSAGITAPSAIANVDQLSFFATADNPQLGLMEMIRVLNFAGAPVGGTINNVQQLNFDTSPAASNLVITGVDSIGFRQARAGSLQGMTVKTGLTCPDPKTGKPFRAAGTSCDTGIAATVNGLPASICFIGEIETTEMTGCDMNVGDKTQTGSSGCAVSVWGNGNWNIQNSGGSVSSSAWGNGGYDSTCKATCLIWSH